MRSYGGRDTKFATLGSLIAMEMSGDYVQFSQWRLALEGQSPRLPDRYSSLLMKNTNKDTRGPRRRQRQRRRRYTLAASKSHGDVHSVEWPLRRRRRSNPGNADSGSGVLVGFVHCQFTMYDTAG